MTAPSVRKRAQPITVAIVDDSAVVRGLFARWLEEAGDIHVVGIHPNGPDALRSVATIKPDVLILDLLMPGMDGLQVLPLVQQLSPGTTVLVVSSISQAGTDMTMRLLVRGAHHYLPKPSALESQQGGDLFKLRLIEKIQSLRGTAA